MVRCCSCPSSLPTGQTSPFAGSLIHSVRRIPFFEFYTLPAAFSPAGRSFLTTNHTRFCSTINTKKPAKNFSSFFALFVCFLFSFLFLYIVAHLVHSLLSFCTPFSQNEQIFNCNCTKESAFSKVSLGKGPPADSDSDSAIPTLSITCTLNSYASDTFTPPKCFRSRYSYQRWCQRH